MGEARARLERRFRTRVSALDVGGRPVELLHPASAEELISEDDFARDERLPYWADLWPSAVVLAGRLAGERGAGRRLLELGCGAGLVAVSAALAGFDVTATDYYEDALHFTEVNVRHNAGVTPRTRLVDWRHLPEDLGTFDVVVASDVLYEHPYAQLVAQAIARTLAPHGTALVADPGRLAADAFVERCRAEGLQVERSDRVPFVEGVIRQTIDLYAILRRPAR